MGEISGQELGGVAQALHYAHEVVAGRIPACKWVKAACQRQLDDLDRWQNDPAWPFEWRPQLAEHVVHFIELLRHVKGKWAAERLLLQPWQKFELACVFGWVRKSDGLRRFRTVYSEVPRKNAKTTKLAGVGLYMLVGDEEWGTEVYSAATTRDQARIVFEIAQQMARMDGFFRARFGVEVLSHSLLARDTAGKFAPLSADGSTLDGLNVNCALIDEFHAHKTRAVYDVLDTGTGARGQPLIWSITTAGSNRAGPCYDLRDYVTRILNSTLLAHGGLGYEVKGGAAIDESVWGIVYTLDDGDDPLDEAVWAKANPNFGVSVDVEDMRRLATKARSSPQALGQFLTKRLNVWVNADSAWMNMLRWDACADPALRIEDFAGEECVIALDAAFKKDLFAKMRLFRRGERWIAFGRYYMPDAVVQAEGNDHLQAWARAGWIRTTPGEVLDIEAVREELVGTDACTAHGIDAARLQGNVAGDAQRFDVRDIGYDPAQITPFAAELLNTYGLPLVELRPTVLNFSPAMKELEERVQAGPTRFAHNGDPVLAWAISNVVCHRDAKDNIYPRKDSADKKIDPAVALIMAIARALAVPASDPAPAIIML